MLKWNYKSIPEKSNGYEDIMDKLKSYKKENYIAASDEEKIIMIDEVFNIYRSKNIFPIQYYSDCGIHKEIQKCIDKEVKFDTDVLNLKFNQGQSICKFLFPNLLNTISNKSIQNTMYNRFFDDYKLKKAIKLCLKIKSSTTPSAIRNTLELIEHGIPLNFKTMNAKALYERYCPPNGVIYDYACGFGGRMLGALSSKNNYTYIGVEPCVETYTHLNELGLHIENVTGRHNSYKLFCMGSEDYLGEKNSVDFAFSSPPYFNLEQYSDEPTQCYNKFNTLEKWFEGYVKPTIENTYDMLKTDSYYAVNIADFKVGKNEIKFVDKWIELATECGFKYIEQIHMRLKTRVGEGHDKNNIKKEGIFLFKKGKIIK